MTPEIALTVFKILSSVGVIVSAVLIYELAKLNRKVDKFNLSRYYPTQNKKQESEDEESERD